MPVGERREYAGGAVQTTLSSGISSGEVTSLTIVSATGWPTGGTGPFYIELRSSEATGATVEQIKVTSRSGTTLSTLTRGVNGTSATAWVSGTIVRHVFTSADADLANQHYADAALDHHTQYTLVAGTRAFTGVSAITAAPGSSAIADAAAAGTATTLARSDHVHGRESAGTPGTSASGDTASAGAAATVARSDHRHARVDTQLLVFAKQGALSVAAGAGQFVFPQAVTIVGVSARAKTAPTGANVILDVNKNGTTLFTTQGNRPNIVASANQTAAEVTNMDVTAVAAGDYLSVDVDQVGSTVAGSDLVVTVRYTRP